jgi:hypothetical protein
LVCQRHENKSVKLTRFVFTLLLVSGIPIFHASSQSAGTDLYDSAAQIRLSRYLTDNTESSVTPQISFPSQKQSSQPSQEWIQRSFSTEKHYSWKSQIVTTIFWVGENASMNNPVANTQSSWDHRWLLDYGGYDTPSQRRNYIPLTFIPRQNPFYVALPYNDITGGHTKAEAPYVIPWFKQAFVKDGQTVLKDRWIEIRHGHQVAYAQWEDCGPFRTDHWQYVFGNQRPRPNLNQGAGLDVSPAVKDYLGLGSKDLCDWKFVDFKDVPVGPWSLYGSNNTFVLVNNKPDFRLSYLLGKSRKAGLFSRSSAN